MKPLHLPEIFLVYTLVYPPIPIERQGVPSDGTKLLYYDAEIQNVVEFSKKEFLFKLNNFIKDKNSLTRIELIEELISLWEDRVNAD